MLVMVSQDPHTETSVLMPTVKEVQYKGPALLLEYMILNLTLEGEETPMSDERLHRAILKITLKRRIEYHLTNTFLQTILLVAVAFAT